MKQRMLSKTLSLTLAAQMAFSPLAVAVDPPAATQREEGGVSNKQQKSWTETFAQVMQGTAMLGNQAIQMMQQRYSMIAAQNQMNALTQQMNPSNCGGQGGAPVQCVSEVFPQCNILNTRPNLVEPAACKQGADPNDPNASGVILGYYNHFAQMENVYKNFNLETNATSNTGLGCLNAQADQLARSLKKREEEIDNLINKMQKVQDKFKADAEKDRNKIEDAMALLDGDSFKGRKAGLDQNSVKFGSQFDDKACKSVFDSVKLDAEGKSKGLKGIEALLAKTANDKKDGGFSAMEFDGTKAKSIESDIRRMADLAGKEIEIKGTDSLTNGFKGLPSAFGLDKSPAFTAALLEQTKMADLDKTTILNEVEAFADANAKSLTEVLQNNKADFDFAVQNWERSTKNECLTNYGNMQDLISGNLKVIDPNGSKTSNRFGDNAYRTFIKTTLARTDISIEKKMELIAAQEGQDGNNRYIVDTQASAAVDGTTIKASTKMSPAKFIQVHVENCKQKFENNVNSKGFSGREVVNKMIASRNKMMNFQKNLAGKVKNSVVDKMLNCSDSSVANASGIATCSPNDLSSSSANFCVKRANACATNMRQCLDKAQKKVAEVTKKRDEAVGQYKANVKKNQDDLLKMYGMVEQITAIDGLNIAASLKQSLTLPTDKLKFYVNPEDRKFIKGLEGMEVEDPDQYFALMKENLGSLKAQIKKQNLAVMNGDKESGLGNANSTAQQGVYGHIANIKKNMDNIMGDLAGFKEMCQAAFQNYMQGRQKVAEEIKKKNEKTAEFCGRVYEMNTMPGCENADVFDDVITAAREAGGGQSGEVSNATAWRKFCKSRGDTNTDSMTSAKYFSLFKSSVDDECTKFSADDPKRPSSCTPLANFKKNCQVSDGGLTEAGLALVPEDKYSACYDSGVPAPDNEYTEGTKKVSCNGVFKRKTGCDLNGLQAQLDLLRNNAAKELASAKASSGGNDIATEFSKFKESRNMGENRNSMCSAADNSGNSVGKTLFDTLGNVMNAAMPGPMPTNVLGQ
ncbi:MAG: hypothetical protein K2P81_09520 [Bacteriovoracaceae bacterium]|nr:hypothetical protein [Bacteriovoracaceae bacterium]